MLIHVLYFLLCSFLLIAKERGSSAPFISGDSFRLMCDFTMLKEKGFQKVQLEKLSLQEQAELFYEADIIIGPHGSGFINLMFSTPKTKVLELHHPHYIQYGQLHFHLYADAHNNPYRFIIGTMTGDPLKQDILIDLNELEKALY